jgi:hypothetical protein
MEGLFCFDFIEIFHFIVGNFLTHYKYFILIKLMIFSVILDFSLFSFLVILNANKRFGLTSYVHEKLNIYNRVNKLKMNRSLGIP